MRTKPRASILPQERMTPEEVAREIGARIRGYREERSMTRAELASRARVSISLLSQVEPSDGHRRRSSPYWCRIPTLLRIAEALGVALAELIPDEVVGC